MKRELNEAQWNTLAYIEQGGGSYVKFQVGEALRRRGLVDRYTEKISSAIYHTNDSQIVQRWCSAEQPVFRHEWYVTSAGRSLLKDGDGK